MQQPDGDVTRLSGILARLRLGTASSAPLRRGAATADGVLAWPGNGPADANHARLNWSTCAAFKYPLCRGPWAVCGKRDL